MSLLSDQFATYGTPVLQHWAGDAAVYSVGGDEKPCNVVLGIVRDVQKPQPNSGTVWARSRDVTFSKEQIRPVLNAIVILNKDQVDEEFWTIVEFVADNAAQTCVRCELSEIHERTRDDYRGSR